MEILEVDSLAACREIWKSLVPQECVFDMWEVRESFARHYKREIRFLVAYEDGSPCGLLALARTDEPGGWGFFPGETWIGKTWLERNRLIGERRDICEALLEKCPPGTRLRYLAKNALGTDTFAVDEVGYLFKPKDWEYSIENFWAAFSGKSRRRNRKEIEELTARGLEIRRDVMEDVETMYALNLKSFGDYSYFADARFQGGFRDMVAWLAGQGCLGVTAVLIEGTVAAVDVHSIYRNAAVVLAGGTHPDFPGVAKVINYAHIEWACQQKFDEVDFLCGEFGWKDRFHLEPRPLHLYHSSPAELNTLSGERAGVGLET